MVRSRRSALCVVRCSATSGTSAASLRQTSRATRSSSMPDADRSRAVAAGSSRRRRSCELSCIR
eukprot:417342-Prymnesium_polylepis.2